MSTPTQNQTLRLSGKGVWSRGWPWVAAILFVGVALLVTGLKDDKDIAFSDDLHLPLKPHEPYLAANNVGATIAMLLVGLTGLTAGIVYYRKTRDLVPVMLPLGSALICIPEVFFDIMGGVYFPWSASEVLGHAYTIMGREMPVWIIAGWFGYGALSAFTYMVLRSKPKTKTLWMLIGGAVVADIVFEEVLLSFGVYHYYGNHPLVLITELPWWWVACNPPGIFLAVALGYRLRKFFQGIRSLLLLVLMPMAVCVAYGAAALPGWIAVNSDYPWLVTQLLGFASLALGFAHFYLILRLVLNRNPFDLNYFPSNDGAEFLTKPTAGNNEVYPRRVGSDA